MGFLIDILVLLFLSIFLWMGRPARPMRGRAPSGPQDLGRKGLEEEAMAGGPDFQYHLGMVCLEQSDEREGFRWLLKSAEGGNAAAQDAIGLMYEFGKGVPRSEAEAVRWYTRAAEQGFPDGEVNLGYLLALGRGVKKDYRKASEWFQRAAEGGYLHGKNSLAWLLATCPDNGVRDGGRAVGILEPVVDGGERLPVLLDTLAAAYAETGVFSRALELAGEALAQTDRASEPVLHGQISLHLHYYELGKPWREPSNGTTPGPAIPERAVDATDDRADTVAAVLAEARRLVGGLSDERERAAADRRDIAPVPEEAAIASARKEETFETSANEQKPLEGDSQSHLDYIVEKLLVVENLLRPLAADSAAHSGEADPASVEHQEAADFSRSLVDAMINDEYGEVYGRMEGAFQNAVPEDQIRPMLDEMYATYGGKPLGAELKAEETGYRLYAGERKRVHKFWYTLRTARQEKGAYSLFVEIRPEEGHLACSTFFIVPPGAGPK